jgi:cyanate permease
LTNLLREDAGVTSSESTSVTRLSWRQVRYVFIDWRIYLYGMIVVGNLTVIKYLTTYFPSLIEDMGYSKIESHLMTAPPYLIACVCCLLAAYSSSRRNEHSFHLIFFLSVALFGFILMLTLVDRGKAAMYVSTCIASCGTFSVVPLILSWLTSNVGGHTKRAMAVGFVLCTGQIGGAVLPQVRQFFLKSENNV